MLRVIQLLYSPATAWQRIAAARSRVPALCLFSFLPIVAIGLWVEGYGLVKWGNPVGQLGINAPVSHELAWRYGLTQLAESLLLVFLGGKLIQWSCGGFNFRATFTQCYTLAVFGLSPFYLARMLDAAPTIHTWVCWAIGALGCVYVLYHGIALVLEPDQTKGFGLYLLSSMTLILLSGLGHFVALAVLDGKLIR